MHTTQELNVQKKSLFDDADIVSIYTRKNAIDDGVLIDVTDEAKLTGFKVPVAMTSTLWCDCVQWSDEDSKKQKVHQDENARLQDVLFMTALAAKTSGSKHCVPVRVYRVERDGRSQEAEMKTFKSHIGPGDSGEPVITLMLMNED